jgi:uncharacterized membrane protein YqjE
MTTAENSGSLAGIRLSPWEETRKKGKWSFVLRQGVLVRGGIFFLVLNSLHIFVFHDKNRSSAAFFLTDALVLGLLGFAWGIWTWHRSERKFEQLSGR